MLFGAFSFYMVLSPKDVLAGRQQEIHAERDRKLKPPDSNTRVTATEPREERSEAAAMPDSW